MVFCALRGIYLLSLFLVDSILTVQISERVASFLMLVGVGRVDSTCEGDNCRIPRKISGPVGLVVGASIAKPRSIMIDLNPVPSEGN